MSENALFFLQYRAALLSLMVDVATMLGAPESTARADMEKALAFETKLAQVPVVCCVTRSRWHSAATHCVAVTDATVLADPDTL